MGTQLAAYYAESDALGGVKAKIRLAMLTRVPSTRAELEPDTPKHLQVFDVAMRTLRAEFGAAAAPTPTRMRPPQASSPDTELMALREKLKGLEATEEWLWGVLSSLHDALVVAFDAEGKCVLSWESKSLHKRYGLAERTAIEGPLPDVVARQLREEHIADIRRVWTEGVTHHVERKFHVSDETYWHHVSFSPMNDSRGERVAVVAFVLDITDRKKSEQQLRENEERLRRQQATFLDLIAHKSMFLGDVKKAGSRVAEAAAQGLAVARASVWLYDDAKSKIVCLDLYEPDKKAHSEGVELPAASFPTYFDALKTERTIAAHEAQTDPRTCEFASPYLAPLGITSMLDVPIWVRGEMVGVVCHEHIGISRTWTPDEENFAYLMANIVSMALELQRR